MIVSKGRTSPWLWATMQLSATVALYEIGLITEQFTQITVCLTYVQLREERIFGKAGDDV